MAHRAFQSAGPGKCVRVLLMSCMLVANFASSVRAQSIDTAAVFDIPAQPMGTALTTLAVQANVQLFFAQEPVAGLQAPAVQGSMTGKEALEQLLAHSSLVFTQNA